MTVDVEIAELQTGRTVIYSDDYEWDDDHHVEWQWSEGNYSCDCNRRLFFNRIDNPDADDPDDLTCTTGSYAVCVRESGTGRVIYQDDVFSQMLSGFGRPMLNPAHTTPAAREVAEFGGGVSDVQREIHVFPDFSRGLLGWAVIERRA